MPERLSPLDAAFLNFEQSHAPMHVGSLCIFEGQPDLPGRPGVPGIFRTVEERLHLVPRYRQKVRWVPLGLGHPVWVDDPDFDLGYHLRRVALPRPGGREELLEVVARLHARRLDRSRPLWEIYIIEGLKDDKVAVYTKTHHAMVDGTSFVEIATILMDFEPEGGTPVGGEPLGAPAEPSALELVSDVAKEAVLAAAGAAAGLVKRPVGLPREVASRALRATRLGELTDLLRPAPSGPLNVKVRGARRIALAPVPLDRVKAIKNSLGGTVNDVVLAVVGEAVHAFLEHRGVDTDPDLVYRIMVPVSVRDEGQTPAVGNRVAAMFMDLPVGRMPARRRLAAVRQAMGDLKDKKQADAAGTVMAITSWAPAALHSVAGKLDFSGQRLINLVVSNVPGVQVPVYTGGARLLEAYPLLPVAANLGVVFCVASYNGGMYFGIVGDYDAFPDLDVLSSGVLEGVENLERAAGIRAVKRAARASVREAAEVASRST
jgi:WS/DGAT/MGAT family acyltransferase